jgi:thiol:disulfide interchange protein
MNHRVRPLLLVALIVFGAFPAFGRIASIQRFDAPRGDRPGFVEVLFSIPEGHYQSHETDFFGIRAAENAPFRLGAVLYPETETDAEGVRKYRGEVVLSAEVYSAAPGGGTPAVTAFYQICLDDGTCLYPEEENLTIGADLAGAAAVPLPLPRLLFFLLLAFAGGLLLNVMPCVLPVLSIKALRC